MLVLAGAGLAAVVVLRRRTTPPGSPSVARGWHTRSTPGAGWYDAIFAGPLRGLAQHVAADLMVMIADDPSGDVLEIGPGPGVLAVELARLAPSVRINGIDIDPAMVDLATRRAAAAGVGERVAFQVGDVARLPYPDGSFDLVTSTFSAHHWADASTGFAEIRRVLRPGGRAVIYDLPDWWGRLERRAGPLSESASGAGFARTTTSFFRWPWRVPLATRLEASPGPTPTRNGADPPA
jgi:SAM-dependent methyltransferase